MRIITITEVKVDLNHLKDDHSRCYKGRDKVIIAIADGITRDCINESVGEKNPKGIIHLFFNYMKQNSAKKAAKLFCKSFIKYLKKSKISEKSIKKAFEFSNKQIKSLNKKKNPNPDYLENDFWACVSSGGIIDTKNNRLYYGFIADCGVSIFNSNGKLKFRTKNEGPGSKGSIDKDVKRKYNASFREERGRAIIRSFYRNNPKNKLSYGALTGENLAMSYIKTNSVQFNENDFIIFYTDGFETIIFSKDFSNRLKKEDFKSLRRLCQENVKTEGTLVLVKVN